MSVRSQDDEEAIVETAPLSYMSTPSPRTFVTALVQAHDKSWLGHLGSLFQWANPTRKKPKQITTLPTHPDLHTNPKLASHSGPFTKFQRVSIQALPPLSLERTEVFLLELLTLRDPSYGGPPPELNRRQSVSFLVQELLSRPFAKEMQSLKRQHSIVEIYDLVKSIEYHFPNPTGRLLDIPKVVANLGISEASHLYLTPKAPKYGSEYSHTFQSHWDWDANMPTVSFTLWRTFYRLSPFSGTKGLVISMSSSWVVTAIHASGGYFAVGTGGGTIGTYSTTTGALLSMGHLKINSRFCCLAFSPVDASSILAIATRDGNIRIWDYLAGSECDVVFRNDTVKVRGDTDLSFSPNGENLVSFSPSRPLCVYKVSTGELIYTVLRNPIGVNWLAWSKDGRSFYSVEASVGKRKRGCWVRDAATGEVITTMKLMDGDVFYSALALSADENFIAACMMLDTTPQLGLWDAKSGRMLALFKLNIEESHIIGCSFSPDGRYIAAITIAHEVAVWAL
ncbi:hypothetical protein ONZ45_g10368 [Pleurotus djamor]|nr:hypothetical protein ONZ45_g10368 [Pleurotus djamor]